MDTAELQTGSREREAIMKSRVFACVLLLFLLGACVSVRGEETHPTIIYDDHATIISTANEDAGQLWITTVDLKRATNFELKPQGVCRNELCFPLPKARRQEFVRKSAGKTWFNIVAFAGLVHQPVAHDEALATWYFGLRSDQRQGLSALRAPDFTLPDLNGKTHSLSDFRGKKVLLLTWASW
jgi:AhpC/TSA family